MSTSSGSPFARSRTRLGKYELGKTLGEGSFAKVKYAKNVQTGDNVAIKIINRDRVLRQNIMEQVMASKTKIYIVLEYVHGGELFDEIARHGRLKEYEARRYFQQLINAVDYCHSRGVYHRDLKPENLLLDSFGTLKVSDFGLSALSKQVRDDGLLHTACGTPNYVAPEVLTDKGYDGTTTDVWSCGVILFVLMAGYLPFEEPNLNSLYRKRITIPEILEDEWFKKDYKPPHFEQNDDVNLDDIDAIFNGSDGLVKRETQFTSRSPANEIISKIEEIAKPLGFSVQKKNYKVFEVAPSLHLVELRKTGGDTLEFHKARSSLNSSNNLDILCI
ncbi:hypothetical protein RND71_026259 [Anisodus tanguticus]|uniref:Protein kinase domain-containing protein n=1 Tax=Anisodus tanguticus TaxID=243964 RepID=A0AAE1RKL5_9SOLA|nr:hypothetical protein RND71_026259 [Anisodus tanguticus]